MAVGIQQRVPADARCVREVRRAISAFLLEHCAGSDVSAGDVSLAVSEACGNVVRHAYPGRAGDLGLAVHLENDRLVVAVSDHGVGLHSRTPNGGLGLGMRLIDQLADADVRSGDGTVVEMRFPKSAGAPAELNGG